MIPNPAASESGYSPPLRIDLHLNGHQFAVAEMGSSFVRLRDAATVPPGSGTLRVELDGRPIIFHAEFFDGIDPERKRQPCRLSAEIAVADDPLVAAAAG